MHIEHASATLTLLSVSTVLCVCACCVCVHWGWGMWVGKILKMESAFVGAVLRLDSCADEATLLILLFPGVVHTSHLSNQRVNHCGAGVRQSTERQLLCHLSHIPKKMSTTVFTHCQLSLFVCNILPPRGHGVFIRLPAEIQPPRKKVT